MSQSSWGWLWALRFVKMICIHGSTDLTFWSVGIVFAWAHEICSDDNEERALVTGCMNEMAYVFQAWLPLLIWQQVDAPMYRKGNIAVSCFAVMMIGTALLTRTLHQREIKQ